jgi:very-short-patch-repair endonuclease
MAAVLAAGPSAIASHRTAARLWGLVDRSGPIEVLIPIDRRVRLAGVVAHRSRHLGSEDRSHRAGIPCASLVRTIIDAADRADAELVGRWIDQGVRDHRLPLATMATRASQLGGQGRPIPASLVRALALRSDGHDPGRSALESRVLAAIARSGLPMPARQWRVERPGGRWAFIDLAYPDRRIAIELDGWAEHGLRSAFDADRARGNDLVVAGWRLLRFTWSMRDEDIVAAIAAALG